MQRQPLPERIDPDAIIEALVECRFEHADLPEAIVGRLLDASLWADYSQKPAAAGALGGGGDAGSSVIARHREKPLRGLAKQHW